VAERVLSPHVGIIYEYDASNKIPQDSARQHHVLMPERANYLEERVLIDSPEQEQAIAKLTAQGWKLVACILDAEAPGDVLLVFRRTEDPTTGRIQ
jgi:hypothetical protein